MLRHVSNSALLIAIAIMAGCGGEGAGTDAGDASAPGDGGLPPMIYWKQPDNLVPDGDYYKAHPKAFSRISRYQTHVKGAERPNTGHRGSFGTGNGYVFGFVGLTDPVNTLHSLSGPTYEKHDAFFGDYALYLAEEGGDTKAGFDEEWVLRSLSSTAVVTRGIRGNLEMDTVDFAPWTSGEDARSCFIRVILVRNRGTAVSPVMEISVYPNNSGTQLAGTVFREDRSDHSLFTAFQGAGTRFDGTRLVKTVGAVQAGSETAFVLLHCAGDKADAWTPPALDAGALLDEAAEAYSAWKEHLAVFDVPDPMVADFLEGMKTTMKVQTSFTGASCPMSEYTRTWTRDNIGPALAWADMGGFEEFDSMIDYMYGAILLNGDLANSYGADRDVSKAPPPPDWASMPAMTGRTAAEGPSYNLLIYGLHHRWTGDTSRASQRFGMLDRCLFAQKFETDRLLTYSGDETYRAAMNAAFGLPLEYPHETENYSSNSSLLWLGAVQDYKMLASALGRTADLDKAAAMEAEVEDGTLKHYLMEDGCFSAFVKKTTMEAWAAPFEDEALQVLWSGWKDGDDPVAISSLDCLIKRIRRAPGELVSKLDPSYRDFFPGIKKGIYTGMLPGYTLFALTETGHPEAADAFNVASQNIDGSGNLLEDMVLDDHSGLSLTYDPVGKLGDYTAKFRPWEGGIVFDAVFKYLTGLKPDASEKSFSIRPHLPNNWPSASYTDLRVGKGRFDLTIQRTSVKYVLVTISSKADFDYSFDLRWDGTQGSTPRFEVDGKAVEEKDVRRTTNFGTPSAETSGIKLGAGKTVSVVVSE